GEGGRHVDVEVREKRRGSFAGFRFAFCSGASFGIGRRRTAAQGVVEIVARQPRAGERNLSPEHRVGRGGVRAIQEILSRRAGMSRWQIAHSGGGGLETDRHTRAAARQLAESKRRNRPARSATFPAANSES